MRYGEPINLDFFASRYLSASDSDAARAVTKSLTAEIEKWLIELTINAPDWYMKPVHSYFLAVLITRLIGIPGLLLVSRGILHGRAVRVYPRKIGSQSHKSKPSRILLSPFHLTTILDSLISSPSPPLHLR